MRLILNPKNEHISFLLIFCSQAVELFQGKTPVLFLCARGFSAETGGLGNRSFQKPLERETVFPGNVSDQKADSPCACGFFPLGKMRPVWRWYRKGQKNRPSARSEAIPRRMGKCPHIEYPFYFPGKLERFHYEYPLLDRVVFLYL